MMPSDLRSPANQRAPLACSPSLKPQVLVVMGKSSWMTWLPEFLASPAISTSTAVPSGDGRHNPLSLDGIDGVVFLSHHETLLADADDAARVRRCSRIPVSCQPREVGLLAADKAAMATLATRVPDLLPIPAVSAAVGVEMLCSRATPAIVEKSLSATEGIGLRLHHADDLSKLVDSATTLLQPFLEGIEFSVNLVCKENRILAFEPVYKGPTSIRGTHPCLRERLCPWPSLSPTLRHRLIEVSVRYARELQADGLVEVELLFDGAHIHFLEVNPRLAATMRLASVACGRSIFAELQKALIDPAWRGGVLNTVCFAGEIPLRSDSPAAALDALAARMPIWRSSRITTSALTFSQLRAQLDEIASTPSSPSC